METKIYKNRISFLHRENKEENGVSEGFAKENPEFEKQNLTNKGCWNCSDCSSCWNCSNCSSCWNCYNCSDCSSCSGCSDCSDKNQSEKILQVPFVQNIHQKIFEAVKKPDALNMSSWHTCDTTHCRAGWVVVLAGEDGKKLEDKTSTLFAAMQIYKRSSVIKVSPTDFFKTNKEAMIDIERCANEELSINNLQ